MVASLLAGVSSPRTGTTEPADPPTPTPGLPLLVLKGVNGNREPNTTSTAAKILECGSRGKILRCPMHWRLKGGIQKALGRVPFGDRLHYQLQKRLGGLRLFNDELARKIDDWCLMARQLDSVGLPVSNSRFLEMGTGWYPNVPILPFPRRRKGGDDR